MIESQKARVLIMLVFLIMAVAVAIFAYEHYHEYDFDDYSGYYIDESYLGNAPDYYDPYNFVAIGDELVYFGDFEIYDYDHSLMGLGDNLYFVCIESMSGYHIGPRMGITVIFNPNTPGGLGTPPGEGARSTTTGDASGGTIGPGEMPVNPSHPEGGRAIRGWNTQADGRGDPFDGNTFVCAVNGPFEVFMIWYVTVNFSLNGAPIPIGTDPNNPNHFVPRTNIIEGWSINETPGRAFPRQLTDPTDWPGFTFWGWWDVGTASGGNLFTGDSPIYEPMMLHARWTSPNNPFITFVPDGGAIAPGHSNRRYAYPNTSINDSSSTPGVGAPPRLNTTTLWPRTAPSVIPPIGSGLYLEGWWTAPNGWSGSGDRWASPGFAHEFNHGSAPPVPRYWANTIVDSSIDVYAHWVYRVIFNPNGGQAHPQPSGFYPFGGSGSYTLFRDIPAAHSGSNIGTHGVQRNIYTDMPAPRQYLPITVSANPEDIDVSRAGYTFNGWWDMEIPTSWNSGGGVFVDINPRTSSIIGTPWENAQEFLLGTPVDASRVVFAHWTRNDSVIITFDPQGGEWYRQHDTWRPRPFVTFGTDNHYVDIPGPGPGFLQGGNIASAAQNGHSSIHYRTMPTFPRKDGYVFMGWFSHPQFMPNPAYPVTSSIPYITRPASDFSPFLSFAGGNFYNRITFGNTSVVASDITVFAHWAPYITVRFNPNASDANIGAHTLPYRRVGHGNTIVFNTFPPGSVTSNSDHTQLTPPVIGTTPITMTNMINVGWNTTSQGGMGAPPDHMIIASPFPFGGTSLSRPGFVTMSTHWQWPVTTGFWNNRPAGTLNVANAGQHWNTCPNGTNGIGGLLTGAIPVANILPAPGFPTVREVEVFAQWGMNLTFNPNLGSLSPGLEILQPPSRTITLASGYSFNTRHDTIHTPPTFPEPNPTRPAGHNYPHTLDFPQPNPTLSGFNWPALGNINYAGNAVGTTFLGWNTRADGTGVMFGPDSTIPLMNPETWEVFSGPMTLYGIWAGTSLEFHGNHYVASTHTFGPPVVSWPTGWSTPPSGNEYRRMPFTVGSPISLPAPPYDPTGTLEFYQWNTQRNGMGTSLPTGNITFTTGTFYAIWSIIVNFEPNGGVLNDITRTSVPVRVGNSLSNANLNHIGIPTRPGSGYEWLFGRWNIQPEGAGTIIVPGVSPAITELTTVHARWDGVFDFNLNGGAIGGNSANRRVWVPEGLTITQTAAANIPAALPPSPAPNHNISANAVVPTNPTHPDPAMIFMGWRVTAPSALVTGDVLNATQIANIQMNGYVNPDDDDCLERTTPNGRIDIEAVWQQRLIFTKVSESFYTAVAPSPRPIETRPNAQFALDRWDEEQGEWVQMATATGAANGVVTFAQQHIFSPPVAPATYREYRLRELVPPVGYILPEDHWIIRVERHTDANVTIDAKIVSITAVANHPLYFLDMNAANPGLIQSWHVGNRRPRLMFTKLDRIGNPLNGVVFVVERSISGGSWEVVYEAAPSGTAIPVFPGNTPPSPTPNPAGVVVITRPFTANSTNQYRLREVSVPDNSGYLIPLLGRWNIITDRYSYVESISVCSEFSVAPNFTVISPHPDNPNYPWNSIWSVSNTPTRLWPFLKTNEYLLHDTIDHTYLPGAVFRLFVYNGLGEPVDLLVSPNMVIPTPSIPMPGTWSLVSEEISNGGANPNPMWFPMMPGRFYQLVEMIAPVGYAAPWGQWRITVGDFDGQSFRGIQGRELNSRIIHSGGAVGTPDIERFPNHAIMIDSCNINCDDNCQEDHMYSVAAYLISNRPEFDLPMTGGDGPMIVTITGISLAGISLLLLFFMMRKGKKNKGKNEDGQNAM